MTDTNISVSTADTPCLTAFCEVYNALGKWPHHPGYDAALNKLIRMWERGSIPKRVDEGYAPTMLKNEARRNAGRKVKVSCLDPVTLARNSDSLEEKKNSVGSELPVPLVVPDEWKVQECIAGFLGEYLHDHKASATRIRLTFGKSGYIPAIAAALKVGHRQASDKLRYELKALRKAIRHFRRYLDEKFESYFARFSADPIYNSGSSVQDNSFYARVRTRLQDFANAARRLAAEIGRALRAWAAPPPRSDLCGFFLPHTSVPRVTRVAA